MKEEHDIDSILEKSLRDTLEEIGGTSVRDSVIYYLREKYQIKLDRMSSNPSALVKALIEIFGVGESLIEKKILEKFLSLFSLKDESGKLEDIIKRAKISAEAEI